MASEFVNHSDVAAIVVHHNRHDSIGEVVQDLIAAGISPSRLIVVDNSAAPSRQDELQLSIGEATLLVVENRGYGAAVNDALEFLDSQSLDAEFVLVATHEVKIDAASLSNLRSALRRDPTLGAVGPTLMDGGAANSETVWSSGGTFSKRLKVPRHITSTGDSAEAISRAWLDGAVVMYRRAVLERRPFDERFFLYMEEVDLHLRLASRGAGVAWVPSAIATQTSSGTPPLLFARNLRLLQQTHGVRAAAIRSRLAILRPLAGRLVRKDIESAAQLLRGTVARIPKTAPHLIVINPLSKALAHYSAELRSVATTAGIPYVEIAFPEPSSGESTRVSWVAMYVMALIRSRRLTTSGRGKLLVIWPVLGYLDSALIRVFAARGTIIVHDPSPLVRAVGHGKFSRIIATRLSRKVPLMTHSQAAMDELDRLVPGATTASMPHPVLSGPAGARRQRESTVVRVMGQYKPDRDLELLQAIATLAPREWNLVISGRGWPQVEGWDVENEFLSEEQFDDHISNASVLLIPYKRFFQSGVAVRALEKGTPVVAPARSVLAEILPGDLLADDDAPSWVSAIHAAVDLDTEPLDLIVTAQHERVAATLVEFMKESS